MGRLKKPLLRWRRTTHDRFFDFRGADFGMNEVRAGWGVLGVHPIQPEQGKAKYAL
jgi:hypothetical protein